MAYSMTTHEEEEHLRVEVSGVRVDGETATAAIQVWQAVARICEKKQYTRILAILDMHGEFPPGSAYQLSSDPASFGWRRHYRVAVVDLNEDSYRQNIFTVTVAANRGYQVKLFREEDEALRWLLEPQE